jgi:Family of unknown function (DUF6311)/Carbohydrate binding domain
MMRLLRMRTVEDTKLEDVGEQDGGSSAYRKILNFEWPRSIWLNLAIALVVGSLYSLLVMGPRPLNPRNIDWLTPDAATYHIGWELFRQDPKLHWPITFTDRLGYPEGESMSLHDPNPLLALLLKPFSPLLPEPFQYLGIEVVLICTLQYFFALKLFRLLLGPNAFAVTIPALFFLIAPPMTYRFVSHYAVSNHWLILACLLLFFMAQPPASLSVLRFSIYAVILAGVAVAINPYLALQALFVLFAAILSLVWQRRLALRYAAVVAVAMAIMCFVVASTLGLFIHDGGYSGWGYRLYSLNGLALIDPLQIGSLLFGPMPHLEQQYEGYNYLGLGAILLSCVVLASLILRRGRIRMRQPAVWAPLLVCALALTALALTTRVMIGSWTLIDLDTHQKLTPYLASFRSSGRLFWTPYYILLAAILSATFFCFRRVLATVLVTVALLVQWVDTNPLRRWVHSEVNHTYPWPLRSLVWQKLGTVYKNLMIMPAWQCTQASSPGGLDGYRVFGFLAAADHMRTNSYYAGRYTASTKEAQCGDAITALSHQPLAPDSAYVVTPLVAKMIADGPTGPGHCHYLDRFILCTATNKFGLRPLPEDPAELLQEAIGDPGFEDTDLSDWISWLSVKTAVSTSRVHSGKRSLAESAGAGSVYQDITGLEPGRKYEVSAWASASPGATATGQIAIWDPGTNLATFSTLLTPGPTWQLMTHSETVSKSGTLRIHLFRNQGAGTIFWDDVRIRRE